MDRVLDRFVDRILKAYERAPLEDSLKALIDSIAVAAAAPNIDAEARRYGVKLAGDEEGPSIVLGLWLRRARLNASITNAFLTHSIEFDDWLAPGYVDVGSVSIPVTISYTRDHSIEEVLRVTAAAYEAALQVGSYFGRSHYMTWHSTASIGSVASAVTYSLLAEGPDPGIVAAAITHALNYMGGLWKVNDASALYKPSSPAHAVLTGTLAGMITSIGRLPIPRSLEEACRSLRGECTLKEFDSYGVSLNGYKFYPSCRHSHTIVEAAERLASEIDPSRINKIEARVFKEAIVVAGKKYPKTLPEARFSIPYLIVTTLVYGELNFDTLGRGLSNPLVMKLMDLVKLKEDPEYTSLYPEKQPAHLTIHQDNGTIEAYVEYPRGDPRRGVNLRDIISKAHQLSHESRDNRIKKLADTLKMASHKESFSLLLDAIAR